MSLTNITRSAVGAAVERGAYLVCRALERASTLVMYREDSEVRFSRSVRIDMSLRAMLNSDVVRTSPMWRSW